MAKQSNILERGSAAELQLRLSKFTHQFPQAGAVRVAFRDAQHKGELFTATPRGTGIGIQASCMAKLFTSTLLLTLVRRKKIHLDDSVTVLLPTREERIRGQLLAVTVVHLLNHTHGLDDTALGPVPLQSDGSIDCRALCTEMASSRPLFSPGALYNYGHGGGYLAGAIVEQLYGQPFRTVLESELLDPLEVRLVMGDHPSEGNATQFVCPSTGGHWHLTEMDVLKLLAQQLGFSDSTGSQFPCGHLESIRACSQRLPGWSPTEKSINLGWKGYRSSWYGHDARAPNSSILARIHAERQVAFVISCTGFLGNDPSYIALSRLFRDWFPELARIDAPRLMEKEAARCLNLGAFTGTYRTRASSILVDQNDGELSIRMTGQAGRANRLRAAEENLFLAAPAARDAFPYIQFIWPAADGRHEYLWNGQNVWRRCS